MDFLRRMVCFALICLLLNLSFVPAFGQNLPSSPGTGTGAGAGTGLPTVSSTPQTTQFSCSTPGTDPGKNVLLPEEVAKLKQKTEVENKGFDIDNISSGRGRNEGREELENNVVVQENDDGSAVVNELPAEKMDVGEVSQWFNKWYDGPFAFGVSLDDTIRIGQCRDLPRLEAEARGCPLQDQQLSYRNSGQGIAANFKNVWSDVKDFVGEDVLGKPKAMGQFSAEEVEQLQVNMVAETDMNAIEAKYFTREVEQIPNSVLADGFEASVSTTGDDSGSLISIYSMFDKYFNSWFSTEMVVSTFGPTLVGQARRYASWPVRKGMPWDISDGALLNWFRRKFMDPQSLYGQARLQRMRLRADQYGFGEVWTKGIENADWDSGYAFLKGGSFRKSVNEWAKKGGLLDQMDDPVVRGEFYKQIRDLRGVGRANKAITKHYSSLYDDAVRKFGEGSPEARAALMEYARSNSRLMVAMDSPYLHLDAPELWVHEEYSGLYTNAFKQEGVENFLPLAGDSKPLQVTMDNFAKNGKFTKDLPFEVTDEGFVNLYKISSTGEFIEDVGMGDIQKNLSRYVDKAAMTEKGDFVKIDPSTIDYIAKECAGTGKVKVYKASWVLDHSETPEHFARRLTHGRAGRISKNLPDNTSRLFDVLVEKNFGGQARHYTSILDKALAQEQSILKSYFSVKGGLKWTLMPYLYWEGKRGFGFEALSAFQLPDSWKTVELYTEEDKIFDDAFIDVFAQHGSDEGEIFMQVLDKLPWKRVYNYVSEKFNPVNDAYEKMTTPMSGWRREVENVAYFTSTREDCATCSVSLVPLVGTARQLEELKEKGRGQAAISFNTDQDMESYFLEDILDEDAKEQGTTLITYGHHTNIRGTSLEGESPTEKEIDLVDAKKDKARCQDVMKEMGFGFLGDDPQRIGALLAVGESLGYVVFGWSGILGSVLQQTLVVPKLQDCVDDVEGYYVHMYASYDESKADLESPNEKASGEAGDVVQSFSDLLLGKKTVQPVKTSQGSKAPVDEEGQPFTSSERNPGDDRVAFNRHAPVEQQSTSVWDRAKDEIRQQADALSEKAKSSEILQLAVETMGNSSGIAFFEKMFFFWFKGNTQQAVYDKQSRSVFEDMENKVAVIVDKEKGEIQVQEEGKQPETVISSEDHVRLSGPDGRVPAEAIPQRIGRVQLPSGPGTPLFEMGWRGQFHVLNPEVLECIRQNVEEQTGVPLKTDDITDAFGLVEGIVTNSYPSIVANVSEKSIVANGTPREIVYGESAKAVVMSDMNTSLVNGRTVPVGNFQSVQFKNGVILFKPGASGEPGELLIWLRYHEKSILRASDVHGLKATVANPIINPLTGCPEPAVDLEAIPNLDAGTQSGKTERVENFNNSLKKMGPFQVFDTESHRFVFYSEKTDPNCNPSTPGCCQDRVSVIDKKTGEVYDQPIVGGIRQTPDGIEFDTADGKTHKLDFSADNGVPTISYNDGAPETLTMARGPNGAFWYDPEEELWHPYNAQLLPLIEAFKSQGFDTRHREDCSSSTIPGSNTMNVNFGGAADTPFNLPSLPEDAMPMLLFILSLMAVITISKSRIEKKFGR